MDVKFINLDHVLNLPSNTNDGMNTLYNKKRLKYNLIIGLTYFLISALAILFDASNFFTFGYLLVGMIFLGGYYFENSRQYLTIENGRITKNSIRPKSINLEDIIHIKNFAGDYILKTDQSELIINKSLVDKNSLKELELILQKLNLDVSETINMPWIST